MLEPLKKNERAELFARPGVLPVYAQGWRGPKDRLATLPGLVPGCDRATLPVSAYTETGLHPDPAVQNRTPRDVLIKIVVVRGISVHDEDWSDHPIEAVRRADSHRDDSECFEIIYEELDNGLLLPRWVITRFHHQFRVYERPERLDGERFWIASQPKGHGLTLAQQWSELPWRRGRLYLDDRGVTGLAKLPVGWNIDFYHWVDMMSDEWIAYEVGFRKRLERSEVDHPEQMFDERINRSRWDFGDKTSPWTEPLEFLRLAYRNNWVK